MELTRQQLREIAKVIHKEELIYLLSYWVDNVDTTDKKFKVVLNHQIQILITLNDKFGEIN